MSRTTARQRRLARAHAGAATAPPVARPASLPASRWALAAVLVLAAPALVIVALRAGYDGLPTALIRFTAAMALMQCTVLIVARLRAGGAGHEASDAAPTRQAPAVVIAAAFAGGAALLVTATLPPLAWLAGLAMFACLCLDAASGRDRGLRWVPLTFALALMVCWVFAGVHRWDALLWFGFPMAVFASFALGSTSGPAATALVTRTALRGAVAGVGLLCSTAALVLAWSTPGAAILIAAEGAFALLLTQRAARRFGRRGMFGVVCAASALTAIVFVLAI